ncbi:MAG: enamine deaminase RidA (YjgF/YER057c/UK114 family) [Akkermansiaceae bacterium]|jgi:enamine deaminase RidA (YjgF/YER057c/UK114 family)
MTPEKRLAALGLELPEAANPIGSYVNAVRSGNLLHISGGLPIMGDQKFLGKVPTECDVETARQAARVAILTRLAVIKAELGSLDQVERIVSISGFVNAEPDFTEHPQVINGASDLLVEIFGEAGKHSRAAVGCSSLPLGVCVEVGLVVEVKS